MANDDKNSLNTNKEIEKDLESGKSEEKDCKSEKSNKCNVCNKSFTNARYLHIHERTHTGKYEWEGAQFFKFVLYYKLGCSKNSNLGNLNYPKIYALVRI